MTADKKIAGQPIGKNIIPNSDLHTFMPVLPTTPTQLEMDLRIEKQVERDGVDMGVLSDGTAFLSGRGLGRLCGVSNSVIVEILADWNTNPQKPRIQKIKEILALPEFP